MPDRPDDISAGGTVGVVTPVDAHLLLNSASIVVLGVSTLEDRWTSLTDAERLDAVARLRRHSLFLAAGLKQLIQPEAL